MRYCHSVNFRESDQVLLQDALTVAESERIDFTSLVRRAIGEYVATKKKEANNGNGKIDQYVEETKNSIAHAIDMVLKQNDLEEWSDQDLLVFARKLRARTEEVGAALKARGYYLKT